MNQKAISAIVPCEHCLYDNEVMFHHSDPGNPDINSSTCCPPTGSYHEPTHCVECGERLLVESDADEMERDAYEAYCDFKHDEMRDERMMNQ